MRTLEMNAWKDIKGYEGVYQVDTNGNVRRIKRSAGAKVKDLTPYKRENYLAIKLFRKGVGTTYYVHRLVAEAFILNPDSKPQVNHKDGNKGNPARYNLEWVTNKENAEHARDVLKIDTAKRGEDNATSILTEADVIQIKQSTLKHRELATIYHVSRSTISMIKSGRTWNHVTLPTLP